MIHSGKISDCQTIFSPICELCDFNLKLISRLFRTFHVTVKLELTSKMKWTMGDFAKG